MYHVGGRRSAGAPRISLRTREERLTSASAGSSCCPKDERTFILKFGQKVPFRDLADLFLVGPSLPRLLHHGEETKSVKKKKKKDPLSPLPSHQRRREQWCEHAGIIFSIRTRFPVSRFTCAKPGDEGWTRDEATCARDARKLVPSLFLSLSNSSHTHSFSLAPLTFRRVESRKHVFSSKFARESPYLVELPLCLLLLRGVDRRPQQLGELTRVHRSGPPQLVLY